MYIVLNKNP